MDLIKQYVSDDDSIDDNASFPDSSSSLDETGEQNYQFTKKGYPRKRKFYTKSLKERKIQIREKKRKGHFVKGTCKCKKNCSGIIGKERQLEINTEFWTLDNKNQREFIQQLVFMKVVKRRTTEGNSRRLYTNSYKLTTENGERTEVCKIFFLKTLGFGANSSLLRTVLKKSKRGGFSIAPKKRGAPHNKIDLNIVQSHIDKFNPEISHYRREHAPNRLYLPSDLNIRLMFSIFKKEYPNFKISYDLYRREVSKKNISFATLGNEECWLCESYHNHINIVPNHASNLIPECVQCNRYQIHKEKYTDARMEYKYDSENNDSKFSVDLQKVIMLPRCDMFKEVIFTPRIIAFNESFVPVGKTNKQQFACLWHEGISGRKKDDIISTFYAFFLQQQIRDLEKITLWLDNCSAQNKNWTLISFFFYIINSAEVNISEIELKFFEPGHSFMSADSFHHSVEMQLRRKKKVYDFEDFMDCVQNTSQKTKIIQMGVNNFFNWENYISLSKLNKLNPRPYINQFVNIKFKRASKCFEYKLRFNNDYTELDILNSKIAKSLKFPSPKVISGPRGVDKKRKEDLLKKLKDILPKTRLHFWENLPISETVDNLDD